VRPLACAILSSAMLLASTGAHAGTMGDASSCRFAGRVTLTSAFALYGDTESKTAIARTGGGAFDVVLDGLSSDLASRHVQLHAVSALKGALGAVTLQGFTDLASFDLHTARDVAVVPDHVWIRGGEAVSVLGAALDRMQIASQTIDWPTVSADVQCADVSLGLRLDPGGRDLLDARLAALGSGEPMLLEAEDVSFVAEPGGKIVYRFTRESTSRKPSVDAFERKAGFTRVLVSGTPFIDAWVESDALEKPPPPAGWTCGGCGKLVRRHVEFKYNQKNIPVVVTTPTTLHLAPHGPEVVASLAVGTPLIGREDLDGWLRVELKNKELIAAEGEAFWIRSTDVVRVKNRRH
jgi:hypothetical protein